MEARPLDPGDAWLEVRAEHRQLLFGGEDWRLSQNNETNSDSFVALARTVTQGGITKYDMLARTRIAKSVGAILSYHDEAARGSAEGPALFGLARQEDLPRVSALTAHIIWLWERGNRTNGLGLPFANLPTTTIGATDFEKNDVQWVVETAAAVCEVLQAGYPNSGAVDGPRSQDLAHFVAYHGPSWATAWIRGDIIRNYCENHGYDADSWLQAIPPNLRARIACDNLRDPLSRVIRMQRSSLDTSAYDDWLNARHDYRRTLFGDTRDGLLEPPGKYRTSLAALSGRVSLRGLRRPEEYYGMYVRSEIPHSVELILRHHDETARSGKGEALFGIPREVDFQAVASLTAKVISLWENVCLRVGRPSLFANLPEAVIRQEDFARTDIRSVVETAAAVCEIIQAGYPTGGNPNSKWHNDIAYSIARRGPIWIRDWLRGDIIREYCARNNFDANAWLSRIPRGDLAFVATNTLNPIRRVREAMYQYDQVLTTKNIMAATGWDAEKVAEVLTPSMLVDIALRSRDSLTAVRRMAKRLDTILTTQNLVRVLQLSPKMIAIIFPPWMKHRLAKDCRDPIPSVHRIVEIFNVLADEYWLSWKLAAYAAYHYRSAAISRANQVRRQRPNRPEDIAPGMWDCAVMRYPSPKDPRRMDILAKYRLWLNVNRPWSLNYTLMNETSNRPVSVEDIAIDITATTDPFDIVTGNEPGDILLGLAAKAGIPKSELKKLLNHFTYGAEAAELGDMRAVLEKLRSATTKQ